jgi:type II secretory pathway component GspD/PulD (secretin)
MKPLPHLPVMLSCLVSAGWRPLIGRTLLLIMVLSPTFDAVCAAEEKAAATPAIVRTESVTTDAQPAVEENAIPGFGAASKDGLISTDFFDADLREVLQNIGVMAGVTIIAAEEVKGLVTLSLSNVSLEKALELLLVGTGYVVKKTPDYYLVCSQKPDAPSFQDICETRLIRLNYLKAATAVQLLAPALKQYVGTDTKDANGRDVSVSAPPKILEDIIAFLDLLDQPPRQVVLDVVIVVMEESKALDLGLHGKWPALQAGTFSDSGLHGESLVPRDVGWPWGVRIGYTPDKEFTESLILTLNTLSQTEQATVIAHPQIMVQEGTEAEINVTTEEYFNIVTDGMYYARAELEAIEVGTKLKILPQIASDGNITLNLTAEISDVVARGEDNLPIVTRRATTSRLRVEDGGTAVIAGLMNNSTRLIKKGIPGLAKVRGLGNVFGNKNKVEASKQVYVLLTPRLLAGKSSAAEQTQVEETPAIDLVGEDFKKELAESLKRLGKRGV